MIQLTRVSKAYAGQAPVLEDISLDMKKGEFLYVVGGSGAGKSSLLRLLATEDFASHGKVSLFGVEVSTAASSTLQAIRRTIGYVSQDVRLVPDLSVEDNLFMAVRLLGPRFASRAVRERGEELLTRLGLASRRHSPGGILSGGEAQRLSIARALLAEPELIVADEPTGAQDRDYTWTVMDLLMKANASGSTVIVATHDREIVRRVRKRCAILRGGRLGLEESVCFY